MAASDTTITELDYAGAQKKIKVRDDGSGNLTPYAVLLANDVAVTTSTPLPITSSQLTAILAGLITAGATSQAKTIDSAVGPTDVIVPGGLVRRDTLTTVAAAVGDWIAPTGDQYGATYVDLATALDGSVDSVQDMPVPNVAAFVHKNADYTTAQTGTDIWTAPAGKIPVVTGLFVSWAGTTDGIITVWISASAAADIAYNAGTDYCLFRATVQPSTKGAGGASPPIWVPGPVAILANRVKVTTSAGITCTIAVSGYEKTP